MGLCRDGAGAHAPSMASQHRHDVKEKSHAVKRQASTSVIVNHMQNPYDFV
jgi:hypothetical protein